jgi:hypothetical protein
LDDVLLRKSWNHPHSFCSTLDQGFFGTSGSTSKIIFLTLGAYFQVEGSSCSFNWLKLEDLRPAFGVASKGDREVLGACLSAKPVKSLEMASIVIAFFLYFLAFITDVVLALFARNFYEMPVLASRVSSTLCNVFNVLESAVRASWSGR